MAGLIRLLFPLIGFLCTATVVTEVACMGYLRYSQILDDDKMFQMIALLNDVDLTKIAEKKEVKELDIPPEEMSYEQAQDQLQVATLQLQSKRDDLNKQLTEFEARFRQLNTENNRSQAFKNEVVLYLEKVKKEAEDGGLLRVRNQLQNLSPKKQAKPLLIRMIKEDRAKQVILLLNGMSSKKRADILKTFDSPEDLEMLAKIQEQMLDGDPIKPFVEEQLKKLTGDDSLETQ